MPLRELNDSHPAIVERLCQARRRGRIGHAYLVTGDNVKSLETFALGWCQVAVCEQPAADGDACGACRPCRQIAEETYPYLFTVRPQSRSRSITVDSIRALEHKIYLKTGGRTKLCVIHGADRMLEQAQNAFLKTLEEPAGDTQLLLLTVSPSALLPTIRSRCQTIGLLENRVRYDFPDSDRFFQVLSSLRRGKGARIAVTVTEYLTGAFKRLQREAEKETSEQVSALKAQYTEMEAAQKKQIDAQCQAVVAAAYLAQRDTLLSALHTWFAREYMRASEVSDEVLPNPEIDAAFGETPPPEPQTLDEAQRALRLAEELITQLRYNVDESLAIQDFCQKVCAKH